MANVNPPLKNQAYAFDVGLKDFSTPGALKANPTLAAGDFLLYIDGVLSTLGAAGSGKLINLPTVVGTTPVVVVTLTAAEMNGDKITVTAIDLTSPMEWEQALYTVNTTAASSSLSQADVRTAVGLASANLDTQLSGIQSDTDNIQTRIPAALVSGRIDASVGAMASGVVTATAVATDAIDADALATDAVTEIKNGVTAALLATVSSGTAQGPGLGSDTIQLASGGVTSDDQYNGYIIALVSGAGSGQQRVVLDSINTGDYLQVVGGNWVTAPDSTTVYILFAN